MDHQFNKTRLLRTCILPLLGASLMAASSVSHALIINGSSSTTAASADVRLLGSTIIGLSAPPTSSATGNNSDHDGPVVGVSADVNALLASLTHVNTGVLETWASSNIDGAPGIRSANAQARVDSLDMQLGIGTSLIGITYLDLTSGIITSGAEIKGSDFGNLQTIGSSSIANALLNKKALSDVLDINGVPVGVNPAANTTIGGNVLGLAGLTLILNEQYSTGNGIDTFSFFVNAIHLNLNAVNLALTGLVSGDIYIGHSEAHVMAVPDPADPTIPEPSSLILLFSGIFSLVRFHRRATVWGGT